MRAFRTLILAAFVVAACSVSVVSQAESLDAKIRRLDLEAAKAIQAKDERRIARFFASDSITNDPRNGLTLGNSGVIAAARSNLIDYLSFERNIESVKLLGDTAIVMGNEVVVSRAKDSAAGEVVRRRYTNIWMKRGKEWVIVARHANVICKPSSEK